MDDPDQTECGLSAAHRLLLELDFELLPLAAACWRREGGAPVLCRRRRLELNRGGHVLDRRTIWSTA
jgi:hypothetical protein